MFSFLAEVVNALNHDAQCLRISGLRHLEACPTAETYFYEQFAGLDDAPKPTGGPPAFMRKRIYVDDEGEPVAVQKTGNEPTALTLAPLQHGPVTIPAGTITYPTLSDGKSISCWPQADIYVDTIHGDTAMPVDVLLADDIAFHPFRLSPWAHDNQSERFCFRNTSDDEVALAQTSLIDFTIACKQQLLHLDS